MIKHYIKATLRAIRKRWVLFSINLFGMGVGIASFLLLYQYAKLELSFDRFHRQAENIFRVSMQITPPARQAYRTAATFSRVGPALVEEMPEVKEACRIVGIHNEGYIKVGEEHFEVELPMYVDTTFFKMFSFELHEGHPVKSIKDVHTAVISIQLASQLFGSEQVVGKVIPLSTRDGTFDYTITGVYDRRPDSHFQSDLLLSFVSLVHLIGVENASSWNWFDYVTYIRLNEGANQEQLAAKLPGFVDKHGGERLGSKMIKLELQPLKDIHLHSNINQEISINGDYKTVMFLLVISLTILGMAWVNYVNLYTAQVADRTKEVGIKKALGSVKSQIRSQFLVESAFANIAALLLGILLLIVAIPIFNQLSGTSVLLEHYLDWQWILILTGLLLSGIAATGIYPAFLLSNYKAAASSESGKNKAASGLLRKTLVAGQFAISAGLITWSVVIYQQFQFMNDQDLGIETGSSLILEVPDLLRNEPDHHRKLTLLKNELLKESTVQEVTMTSDIPGKEVGWRGSTAKLGVSGRENPGICLKLTSDEDYLKYVDADLLAGRFHRSSADSNKLIINERALDLYGLATAEEAIGQLVWFAGMDTLEIIGVIANYFQESLREDFKATAYFNKGIELTKMMVKLNAPNAEAPERLKATFASIFPNLPFEYAWLDDQLQLRHSKEDSLFKVFKAFTLLALLLCFLGLISLSYFMASKRLKEIGIRKTLGASFHSILKLLFKDIVLLALIGNVVMAPIVAIVTQDWLGDFAFRVSFQWSLLILTLLTTIFFGLVSTGYQVLRATQVNPTKVLRVE